MRRATRAGLPEFPLIFVLAMVLSPATLLAVSTCDGTPAYTPCDMVFELNAAEAAQHPDPYRDLDVQVEFRSPQFKTFLIPAFWDGGNKFVLRVTPTVEGIWTYKITGNVPSLDGRQGSFTARASDSPGFIHAANVHHWQADNKKAHLWIGDVADRLAFAPQAELEAKLASTVKNKFTHLRISVLGGAGDRGRVFAGGRPNPEYFDELDRRIETINAFGVVVDLMLADTPPDLVALAGDASARERLVRFLAGRVGPLNVSWEGVKTFEDFPGSRELLKEVGLDIQRLDPYQHPRSTNASVTSSPLLNDGWMTFAIERNLSPDDDQTAQIEHQLYPVPFVGLTTAARLWDATTDGQYPMFEGKQEFEAKTWFEFVSDSRHWELEPYYDVDGGRALALEGIEYILYVDHPGPPVEVEVEHHGFDGYVVTWLNPLTGETEVEKKKYRGEHYTGLPPDNGHPWVLRVSRENEKESMLKSYYFDSKTLEMQEIESNGDKVVYEVAAPAKDSLRVGTTVHFSARLKRTSRATREMRYLWTGEVSAGGEGFRVLGNGAEGDFHVSDSMSTSYPATMLMRLYGLNANGKLYEVDKAYTLTK